MPPDGVIEPVDVSGDGVFCLVAGLPRDWPDQLGLDGFEEREEDQKTVQWTVFPTQDHRVVVAVPTPAHPLPAGDCLQSPTGRSGCRVCGAAPDS